MSCNPNALLFFNETQLNHERYEYNNQIKVTSDISYKTPLKPYGVAIGFPNTKLLKKSTILWTVFETRSKSDTYYLLQSTEVYRQ